MRVGELGAPCRASDYPSRDARHQPARTRRTDALVAAVRSGV